MQRLLIVLATICLAQGAMQIYYRPYSNAATMGPMGAKFAAKFADATTAILGDANRIEFIPYDYSKPVPPGFANVLAAVEAGLANGGLDAAYISGGDLNSVWGFLYNSAVPFGPSFDEFAGFLYGKSVGTQTGLELLQSIYTKNNKNVYVLPVVASSEQVSGYFKAPIGNAADGTEGIGLAGLCQKSWTLRYLPPAQYSISMACDNLVARGVIPQKNLKFIAAVPGGGSFLSGLQAGTLDGFEFATPLDDISQGYFGQPVNIANYGPVSNRFMHAPAWQQPFLMTYMLVNKAVYNSWTPQQQALFYTVARDNVIDSWGQSLQTQGDSMRLILSTNKNDDDPNNDFVQCEWPLADQKLLQEATLQYLKGISSNTAYTALDRADYTTVWAAIRNYALGQKVYWDTRAVHPETRFKNWEKLDSCPAGSYIKPVDGAMEQCALCPVGTYGDAANVRGCTKCPAGTFADVEGLTACKPCATGSISDKGAVICTQCKAGFYEIQHEMCAPCPKGSYQALAGSTSCNLCAPGTFSEVPGQTACSPCDAGTFAASFGARTCRPCARNNIAPEAGSAKCDCCPAGQTANSGHTACIPK